MTIGYRPHTVQLPEPRLYFSCFSPMCMIQPHRLPDLSHTSLSATTWIAVSPSALIAVTTNNAGNRQDASSLLMSALSESEELNYER